MKWSNWLLAGLLTCLVLGLLASNRLLKAVYDKKDKSDLYWTYDKVLTEPFRYLKLIGGNITNITFEQSEQCSVRVLDDWNRNHAKLIDAFVIHDTLVVKFIHSPENMGEERWMKWSTLVRIFAPQLLLVEGSNTNLTLLKLHQKSIGVNLSGKSTFEIESNIHQLDTLVIAQKDSSEMVLEMSPDALTTGAHAYSPINNITSPEAMTIRSVRADLQGNTLLDIGHAQIDSLQLRIADSSAVFLSGGALRSLRK